MSDARRHPLLGPARRPILSCPGCKALAEENAALAARVRELEEAQDELLDSLERHELMWMQSWDAAERNP